MTSENGKLTMRPVGWNSDGPSDFRDDHVNHYEVSGLSGKDHVAIFATSTGQEGTTWAVIRKGESKGIKYPSAQAALNHLSTG